MHPAAHAQHALVAAVVLDRDHQLGARPQAAVHLDVPLAPALIDRDLVAARIEELDHAPAAGLPSRCPISDQYASENARVRQSMRGVCDGAAKTTRSTARTPSSRVR